LRGRSSAGLERLPVTQEAAVRVPSLPPILRSNSCIFCQNASEAALLPHCRPPCKSLSRENTVLLTRASEERALRTCQIPQLAPVPLGGGSCLRRTGHPFAVSGPEGPSQKIECVFSASPETIRREPREFDLRRSVGKWQDLAVCAPCNPVFPQAAVSMPLRSCELL
jgi:hypothetical protein